MKPHIKKGTVILMLTLLSVMLLSVGGCIGSPGQTNTPEKGTPIIGGQENVSSQTPMQGTPVNDGQTNVSGPVGENTGTNTNEQDTPTVNIEIKNFGYTPSTTTISVGTTVTWTQYDTVRHDVTSDTGVFHSPLLNKGESWSYTFDKPGTYTYHCTPHPSMIGTIVVE